MEGLFFNVDHGYVEALVRGYKNGLLSNTHYVNLSQCDSLDDLKLQLSATDYGNLLADCPTLSTSLIESKLNGALVSQVSYIRSQATDPLSGFLDYMSFGYMIDNVALMITGTIHNRDRNEILRKCNPLGWFETLPTLSIASDLDSLYETVLIDTPLAKYFTNCLSIDDLDDLNIEIIRNCLYKEYLEDFYNYAQTLPEPSNEIMQNLLSFEADKRAINIVLNSIDSALTPADKEKMLPTIGSLADPALRYHLTTSTDLENLKMTIQSVGSYKSLFDDSSSLEDKLYEYEMGLCKDAFTQQFTISTVWAWVKSKEQEVRNITWIAECIAQGQMDRVGNYISVY
ncbi:H(+)-transporting V0 sector ATPase subunit D [Martiniozyma asiatica (nom. inval.)]|nr:H(+)-transporting V0 sector ATPase subunit D [Martiniozyma asiatica]